MKEIIKKFSALIMSLMLVFNMGIPFTATEQPSISIGEPAPLNAIFADTKVAESVKEELALSSIEDIVTQEDLETIKSLTITGEAASSIKGIEYLNNLEQLNIDRTSITNFTLLTGMTHLKSLGITHTGNGAGLTDNDASTIPLASLPSLEQLNLSGNQLTHLGFLAEHQGLQEINVDSNKDLNDISAVSTQIGTLTSFSGSTTMIDELSAFRDMQHLQSLTLYNVYVNSLAELAQVYSLEVLNVTGGALRDKGGITDASVLQHLPNLKSVNLLFNEISDPQQFNTGFPALQSLTIDNQYINVAGIANKIVAKVSADGDASAPNIAKSRDGSPVVPASIYNGGVYNSSTNTIEWSTLLKSDSSSNEAELEDFSGYTFSTPIKTFNGLETTLGGAIFVTLYFPVPVIFHSNGGTSVAVTGEQYKKDLIKEPAEPTKEGHVFAGWYTDDESFLNAWDFSVDTIPTEGIELYAKWDTVPTYTITYDGNGQTAGEVPTDATGHYAGDTITLPTTVIKKDKYTFAGWNDGMQTYQSGDTYTMPNNNVTFTAQWRERFTITATDFSILLNDVDASNFYSKSQVEAFDHSATPATKLPNTDITIATPLPTTVGNHQVTFALATGETVTVTALVLYDINDFIMTAQNATITEQVLNQHLQNDDLDTFILDVMQVKATYKVTGNDVNPIHVDTSSLIQLLSTHNTGEKEVMTITFTLNLEEALYEFMPTTRINASLSANNLPTALTKTAEITILYDESEEKLPTAGENNMEAIYSVAVAFISIALLTKTSRRKKIIK